MFSHAQIWGALDKLAESHGLSASGLAKAAGLDATSFNKSKRVTPEGRQRWPTTESIAKCLNATGATLDEFTQWYREQPDVVQVVSLTEVMRPSFCPRWLPGTTRCIRPSLVCTRP